MAQKFPFEQMLAQMQEIPKDGEFYCKTLTADEKGGVSSSWQTHWAGFSEGSPRYELRAPSLVYPDKMARLLWDLGQACVVVTCKEHLFLFHLLGGHGLIARDIAERFLAEELRPSPCGITGELGFKAVSAATPDERERFPRARLRNEILTRDARRCRSCGARPATNEHVELQLHHVHDFELGGLTTRKNLLTLCKPCHVGLNGLKPSDAAPLQMRGIMFEIDPPETGNTQQEAGRHRDAVVRYREKTLREFQKLTRAAAPKKKSSSDRRATKKRASRVR